MSIFSDRLIAIRKDLNLTQKDIADRFSVTRSAYSAWELARNEPPLAFVRDFCSAYDISSDFLLGLTDIVRPSASISMPPQLIPRSPLDDLDDDLRARAEGYIASLRDIQAERSASSQQEA